MKKNLLLVSLLFMATIVAVAESPKHEFRGTWFTTVSRIDWPKTVITSTGNATQIAAQKQEMDDMLDKMQEDNLNACLFQVRPNSDAFYQSKYEPWSSYLTGTRGKDPGYDPLAYAIEACHSRGMELHVWINPFRYESSKGSWGNNDIRKNHPKWILDYSKLSILDPGQPEVRAYIVSVIEDIISNYDVDGVIFDDYFYPYAGTNGEDSWSETLYKPADMNVDDWRRQNIDQTIEAVYDKIQSLKPWVRFGVGPFGIWTTQPSVASQYGVSLPSGITGSNTYQTIYCNTLEWVKQGTVDYISPQLYWPTTQTGQQYNILSPWWYSMTKHFSDLLPDGKQVHCFPSHALYKNIDQNWADTEMPLQISINRQSTHQNAPGSVFYNTNSYQNEDKGFRPILRSESYTHKALPPAMSWKESTALSAPTDMVLSGKQLTWKHDKAERYTVYAFPKSIQTETALKTSAYLLGITYTASFDVSGGG